MEGDAGAGRLNPPPMPMIRRLRRLARRSGPKIRPGAGGCCRGDHPEVTAEESPESEDGADETSPASEESREVAPESADGTDETSPASEESPESEDQADETGPAAAEESQESEGEADAAAAGVERGPSRLGRGWLAGIAAALVLFAGGLGAGGYFALRSHQRKPSHSAQRRRGAQGGDGLCRGDPGARHQRDGRE